MGPFLSQTFPHGHEHVWPSPTPYCIMEHVRASAQLSVLYSHQRKTGGGGWRRRDRHTFNLRGPRSLLSVADGWTHTSDVNKNH